MRNATNYNFVSNNIKGIQVSKKRLKLFEYLKSNINFNGFILFQETHSSLNDEKQWKDEFNGPLFFLTQQNKFLRRCNQVLWKKFFQFKGTLM